MAWDLWSSNAESWLQAHGVLVSEKAERRLGSIPTLTSSAQRIASMQSIEERQLRRHIRRLDEALVMSRKGSLIPSKLFHNIFRGCSDFDEKNAVSGQLWGVARKKSMERLTALIQTQQKAAVQKWRDRVHTVPGACRWLRQDLATPYAVRNEQGDIICSKPEAVCALRSFWKPIFGQAADACNAQTFFDHYDMDFPHSAFDEPLPLLTAERIIKALRKMKGRAGGPDGWSPDLLLHLPAEAFCRL